MKKFILALFILYLPFQLRLPQIPVINTVNLFLILLLIIFIFGRNRAAKRTKFDTPLLIFLIIWSISFFHTLSYPVEIWRYEITVLFKRLVSLVLVYFVFSRCVKTKKELQFLFYIFLIGVVLVGLHTFRNGMLAGPHFADFKRSSGPFGKGFRGSDIAGAFLATFAPFLLSFSLLAKKIRLKILGFIGLAVCIMGVFATYSRGSMVALGVASIVTILFAAKNFFKTSKISVVILIAIFIGAGLGWRYWIPESIITRMNETVQGEVIQDELYPSGMGVSTDITSLDQSSQGRINKWRRGMALFLNNPIFGFGFKIPELILSTDTHNTFIQIAAEMGIFGILVFIWFLWRVFMQSGSLLNTEFVSIGVGFIGCITAFIIVNMFYSNFFRDTVVGSFWIMLGILASCKNYVTKQK